MEIELDKKSSFTLEMKIDGDASAASPPAMRFSILTEEKIISFLAKRIENGIYQIDIPELKGMLEAGEYTANVEVFLDNKHFVPLTQKVKVKQEIKPIVKMVDNKDISTDAEPKVTIAEIKPKTLKVTKTDEIIHTQK